MLGEIDILLLVIVVGVFISLGISIYFISTELLRYKLITLTFIVVTISLEIPHMLFSFGESSDMIDILVHVSAGLSIFMISTNLPIFKNKLLMGIVITVMTILLVESFLSILELTIGYVNPIGWDVFEDILWTTIGSLGGGIIYTVIK